MLGQFPRSWRVSVATREADIYLGFGLRSHSPTSLRSSVAPINGFLAWVGMSQRANTGNQLIFRLRGAYLLRQRISASALYIPIRSFVLHLRQENTPGRKP